MRSKHSREGHEIVCRWMPFVSAERGVDSDWESLRTNSSAS